MPLPLIDPFDTMPGSQRRGWPGVGMTVKTTPDVASATRLVGGVWGHPVGDAMDVPHELPASSNRDLGRRA